MPVRVERRDRVLTVIHSRPEARNAVDPEHAEALYQAFVAFDADDAADIAVFWGEGGAFCAGADLKRLASRDPTTPSLLEFPKDGGAVPRAPMGPSRLRLSKPVIAAIEGPAVAGGMELALWADCRVMADGAYMGIYNRRWGVPLSDGGTVRLPRLVGQGRALEIIMTGVDAEECLRIGLCEMVVPEGQARRAAEEMAHGIARFPQACVRADRRSVYLQHGRPSTPLWSESGPTAPGCSKRRGPLAPRDLPRARGGMAILAISGGRTTDRLTQAITSNCRRHGPARPCSPRQRNEVLLIARHQPESLGAPVFLGLIDALLR
jgi:enoyl-CoA hydratase